MIRPGTLALLLSTAGCGVLGIGGDVRVRVTNASSVAFDRVVLYPGGADSIVALGLVPGASSGYQVVDRSYQLATTRVVIGNDTLSLQVIDYVGEEPVGAGDYTFVLDLVGEGAERSLSQVFRED